MATVRDLDVACPPAGSSNAAWSSPSCYARCVGSTVVLSTPNGALEGDSNKCETLQAFEQLPLTRRAITSIAISAAGDLIVAASAECGVCVWRRDVPSGGASTALATRLAPEGSQISTAVSRDGEWMALAVCTANTSTIYIYNTRHWDKVPDAFTLDMHHISAVAFSADGTLIAACSTQSPSMWSVNWRTGGVTTYLCTDPEVEPLPGFSSLAFSPANNCLVGCTNDGRLRTFVSEAAGGVEELGSPVAVVGGRASAVSWSQEVQGRSVHVLDGVDMVALDDHGLVVCTCNNGTVTARRLCDQLVLMSSRYEGAATAVECSADLSTVAVGTSSGAIVLFSMRTAPHSACVTAIAFSPDGAMLATATSDAEVHLWLVAPQRKPVCVATKWSPFTDVEWLIPRQLLVAAPLSATSAMVHVMCVNDHDDSATVAFDIARRVPDTLPVLSPSNVVKVGAAHITTSRWCLYAATATTSEWGIQPYLYQEYSALEDARLIQRSAGIMRYLSHPRLMDPVAIVDDANHGTRGILFKCRSATAGVCESLEGLVSEQDMQTEARLHQVGSALQFLHERNCVHGGVRPEAVFLVPEASLLGCFEGATLPENHWPAIPHAVCPTDDFCAPEVRDGARCTKASDVFSFGRLLRRALYPGWELPDMLLPTAGAGDDALVHIINQCCASDPKARPHMAHVMSTFTLHIETSLLKVQSILSSKLYGADGLIPDTHDIPHSYLAWKYNVDSRLLLATPDPSHPMYRFVCRYLGDLDMNRVERIVIVGAAVESFLELHNFEDQARTLNSDLRTPNRTDPASEAAITKLKDSFVDRQRDTARARLLLAWHGTAVESVADVVRDKARNLHKHDAGFFGSGSYFSLEAAYAARYPATTKARAIILNALSVSQALAVTVENDYAANGGGFSNFYPRDKSKSAPLARHYDAYFVPVKHYGCVHPKTNEPLGHSVSFQACHADQATAHEIVMQSHLRTLPLAIVYLKSGEKHGA